ncbi:pimeloyl-ACP methyl ester carboxylesterase [Pseudarthrobacter sp. W1I19]|uniref:alpha/beta fold hydrolase n=1 Tax=Pseudarthrobacter sp. W1I19 TaxID=3042288 RepID=UPI002787AC24|nr:alpha/beta hydrolase [Pseudarthrobacter sp. W1I19]MDQ0921510.1 pimeloyl-ACP methyl ester carboxylesterase [Pseudarthrobacter sp. W1I19]
MHNPSPQPDHKDLPASTSRRTRRRWIGAVASVAAALVVGTVTTAASAPNADSKTESWVTNGPKVPADFSNTFKSTFVEANGIRQHAVVGGEGPAVLLIHGWPEDSYAWRSVMQPLAENHTVIAVDQRGIGLTEKPADGYDTATLADDLAALMTELGHEKFSVIGHDTGYFIGYALAADHRDRVERFAGVEVPGPPGITPDGPPLFLDEAGNNRLWHIPFNRVDDELIVNMVASNADAFYRYEYQIQGGGYTPPEHAIKYYVKQYNHDKDTLRASFELYREWDTLTAQNAERAKTPLTIPVIGIGGADSWGTYPADGIRAAAPQVQTAVIPGAGHWVAEQAPEELVKVLRPFLASTGSAG